MQIVCRKPHHQLQTRYHPFHAHVHRIWELHFFHWQYIQIDLLSLIHGLYHLTCNTEKRQFRRVLGFPLRLDWEREWMLQPRRFMRITSQVSCTRCASNVETNGTPKPKQLGRRFPACRTWRCTIKHDAVVWIKGSCETKWILKFVKANHRTTDGSNWAGITNADELGTLGMLVYRA